MATIATPVITSTYNPSIEKPTLLQRFATWCAGQQEARLLWLALALMGHGAVLTPITGMAVVLAGTNLFMFVLVLLAMAMTLVTNLAALPTKITIPVFILSVVIDVVVLAACIAQGLNLSNAY